MSKGNSLKDAEQQKLAILEKLKGEATFWRLRKAVLSRISQDSGSRQQKTMDVEDMLSIINQLKEEQAALVQAIRWLTTGKQSKKEEEPASMLPIQMKWQLILRDSMSRQESSIFSWKTLFSLLETLKEDKLIDIKVNRQECISKMKQLLESDQTGFQEDTVDAQKRSMERCRSTLDCRGQEWKVADQCIQACRRGLITTYRAEIYSAYWRVTSTNDSEEYKLKLANPSSDSNDAEIEQWMDDSIEQVMEDEAYFLFKEGLISIVQAFMFDTTTGGGVKLETSRGRPIANIPFKSIGSLVAPFFYCSTNTQEVYWLFREMYSRHFIKLSSVTASQQGILYLSQLFEQLFRKHLKQLHVHLLQLGTSGLRLAFKWLFFSFVGYLDVQQVFQLFDRIIGFDSNQVLVFLALGIFTIREEELLECEDIEQVDELLADLHDINFVQTTRLFLSKVVGTV